MKRQQLPSKSPQTSSTLYGGNSEKMATVIVSIVKFKSHAELKCFGHTKCTENLLSFSSKPYNEEWTCCGILDCDEELYFGHHCVFVLTAVTALSKPWVCSLTLTGIAASNPAESVKVCLLSVLCVRSGRSLCSGQVTRPEESY
jgi:hypothetical protein